MLLLFLKGGDFLAVDGSLIFDTNVDSTGFEEAMSSLTSELQNVQKAIKSFGDIIEKNFTSITSNVEQAKDKVSELDKAIDNVSDISVEADTSDVKQAINEVQAVAQNTGDIEVDVSANTAGFSDEITNAVNAVENSSVSDVDVGVNVDTSDINNISDAISTAGGNVQAELSETDATVQAVLNNAEESTKTTAENISDVYEKESNSRSNSVTKAGQKIKNSSKNVDENRYNSSKNTNKKIVDNYNSSESKISKSISGLKSALGKIAAVAAAAFGIRALVNFGKQSVATASDLAETQNVVDVSFGSMSDKMEKFSDTCIETYGISKLTAKQTGSTFAAMGKGIGLALDNSTDMAVSLAGLSADMASFYNVSQDVSKTALKSIYTGETETLKQYGIVMTQANLQQFAMSQGISESIDSMTEQEKVMLRYNFVMSRTTLAQGDFARTSDSWTNQTRMLSEKWKEFGTIIGNVLMQVLLPAVKMLNSVMTQLISVANQVSQALADVFGFELGEISNVTDSTSDMSDYVQDTASSYEDMAKSAEKAKKANEVSLASFDKVNKLGDSKQSDSSNNANASALSVLATAKIPSNLNVSADIDTKLAKNTMTKFLAGVKKSLSRVFYPMKQAWNNQGAKVVDSIHTAFGGVKTLISEVGKSFLTVWNNGTGQQAIEYLLSIWTNINNVIGTVSQRFAEAWNDGGTGTAIVQNILDIFNNILKTIDNITSDTVTWAQNIDFSPLLKSFDSLTSALRPLTENIFDGIKWFWNNILLPLASYYIEDYLPAWWETLAAILDVVTAAIEALKPMAKWLWDNFLQPLASWTGGAIVSILETLAKVLKSISDWMSEHQTTVQVMTGIMAAFFVVWEIGKLSQFVTSAGGVVAALKTLKIVTVAQTIAQKAMTVATTLWQGLCTIATVVTTAFGAAVAFLTSPITLVVLAIVALIAIVVLVIKYWDEIKAAALACWEGIKDAFSAIGEWIYDNVIEPVINFFVGLWEGIKNVFAAIGEWFSNLFTKAWEGIKKAWNAVVDFFVGIWDGICNVFTSVGDWFSGIFTTAWEGIKTAFSAVGKFFSDIWQAVKKPFVKVADWFKDIFSKAWEGVKNVFSSGGKVFDGIKDGISDVFFTVVNGLISGINKVIEVPFNGINWALKKIKGISIAGFEPFSWISTIDVPQIPRLATGTVVPANYGEFAAILGDNKREVEVVSPLSTMKKAFKEALAESGGSGGGVIQLIVNLDGKTIYKSVVDTNKKETQRTGVNALAY